MANWIRVAQVKYQNPQPTVQEVKLKLQEAFQSVGLPAQSLPHLFAKFRNNQPEVCHVSTSSNAKDHLRLSWVTRANLEEWHIGFEAALVQYGFGLSGPEHAVRVQGVNGVKEGTSTIWLFPRMAERIFNLDETNVSGSAIRTKRSKQIGDRANTDNGQ